MIPNNKTNKPIQIVKKSPVAWLDNLDSDKSFVSPDDLLSDFYKSRRDLTLKNSGTYDQKITIIPRNISKDKIIATIISDISSTQY